MESHSGPPKAPCKACTDFKTWASSQKKVYTEIHKVKAVAVLIQPQIQTTFSGCVFTPFSASAKSLRSPSVQILLITNQFPWLLNKFIFLYLQDDAKTINHGKDPVSKECPLDRQELGRNSWSVLHTMAAYYSETPTTSEQKEMQQFISLFTKFYPCHDCSEDFMEKYVF